MYKIQNVREYPFVFQSSYPLERPRLSQNRSTTQIKIAEASGNASLDLSAECKVSKNCKIGGSVHIGGEIRTDPPKKEAPPAKKEKPTEEPKLPVTLPKNNCWWTNSCKPIPPNLEDL